MLDYFILFFFGLQLLLLFTFAVLIMSLTGMCSEWVGYFSCLVPISDESLQGIQPLQWNPIPACPSRWCEGGGKVSIYSWYCRTPWVVRQCILFAFMTALCMCCVPYFMDGNLKHNSKGIQRGFLRFCICVLFCSVLHILFRIKITEVEHFGLVEILLKTFL